MSAARRYSRRDALGLMAAAGGLAAVQPAMPIGRSWSIEDVVARNDAAVRELLQSQITDSSSPWRGSVPDQFGLHSAHSAAGVAETMSASLVHPQSRFRGDPMLLERIKMAAGFMERSQSARGNIDLLTTNFDSPPDTGFVVHSVATAAIVGRMHGAREVTEALQPFLLKAGAGLAVGGVHTPNHRWVIGSALAQINELFPDARLVRRIDEWLAEGIDIDADGQFTERSTLTYNVVTDRALVVMATKLRRSELVDPVRRNLRALAYLLHADGEVVTEISRRQDQYTRGSRQPRSPRSAAASGCACSPAARKACRSRSKSVFAMADNSKAARRCRGAPTRFCSSAARECSAPAGTRSGSARAARRTATCSSAGPNRSCPVKASTSRGTRPSSTF